MSKPFNPLDMENLGLSITTAMAAQEPTKLAAVPAFKGAGVYAIYYRGWLPIYHVVAEANTEDCTVPVYVGKAVPSGGRKGVAVEHGSASTALSKRLREHAKSVDQAENLDINDFWCRWLVVEPIFIPLGESVMISRFTPVWNGLVDGFGNHDPGSGRINGLRSRWDTLHPGRPFAAKYPPHTESPQRIELDVVEYLRSRYQV